MGQQQEPPTEDRPPGGRYIGKSTIRREDRRLVSGHGSFVSNLPIPPGTLHAAFARSWAARGTIRSIDLDAARSVPGVVAVLTGADLNPRCGPMAATMYLDTANPPTRPLAHGDVRFVGESVALVLADTEAAAIDGAALIEIDIEQSPAVIDLGEAASDRNLVHSERSSNVVHWLDTRDDERWACVCREASYVVTRTFEQRRAAIAPIEASALIVDWDQWTLELRVWIASQNVHEVRATTARMLGLPERHIRVIAPDVGGGFGQKVFLSCDEAAVILAAHLLGRRVRWIERRDENLLAAGHARHDRATATVALDADGVILGLRVDEHLEDAGAFPVGGAASGLTLVSRCLPGPYRVPVAQYRGAPVYTNTCGRVSYRGPWLMETIIREQLLDHAARVTGIDPLELRRRNVLVDDDLPYVSATGASIRNVTPAVTLDRAAELVGYDAWRHRQRMPATDGRLIGVGIASLVEPSGMGVGILGTEQATLRISMTGQVEIALGTGSTGNSLETTIPQVVADVLGCAYDDVSFRQGDTASTPWGHGSGGSRAAVSGGGAAREASIELRARVLAIAADMLEASVDDIDLAESVVGVRGTPARKVRLADVARRAFTTPEATPPGQQPGLEVSIRYRPPDSATYSNATHACAVAVDPDTGAVEVLDYVVSEDCGVMINPMIVDGQLAGGVAQGIAGALFEEFHYDADGVPRTIGFGDYLIPSAADLPSYRFDHVETPSATSGGFKGMGEGSAIVAPAAIANAVCDAIGWTGERTILPLSPERVWRYLQGDHS